MLRVVLLGGPASIPQPGSRLRDVVEAGRQASREMTVVVDLAIDDDEITTHLTGVLRTGAAASDQGEQPRCR